MHIRLAVEDMESNHWIVWALDLPGCYSSAVTASNAIAFAPQKIAEYYSWLKNHGRLLQVVNETIETEVVESFHSFASSEDPEYLVNAFFEDDRLPLETREVETALKLMEWCQQDLIGVIQTTTQDQRTQSIIGEVRGSINGILKHIAIAENWYFSQKEFGLE
jgi:hypothetical protein